MPRPFIPLILVSAAGEINHELNECVLTGSRLGLTWPEINHEWNELNEWVAGWVCRGRRLTADSADGEWESEGLMVAERKAKTHGTDGKQARPDAARS